ncbi:MAG: hypothetical protein IKR39_10925 [Lachnospiraceae bacterium]|nr:hypothetical protein [Lachnospiraceae bacterium]
MKKNIRLNKQIIKALSIGISASMLLQPVTAFADELDTTTTPEPVTDGSETSTQVSAFDAAETLAEDDADVAVEKAINASHEAVDTVNGSAVSANFATETQNLADALDENEVELARDAAPDALTDIEGMEDADAVAQAADVSAGNALTAAETAESTVESKQTEAEKLASDTLASVSGNAATVETESENLKNASSVPEAREIFGRITTAVGEADTTVKQAEKDFAEIEEAFNTAKTEYETQKRLYDAALVALNEARAEFAQLQQDATDGVENAPGETQDALARLNELETQAHALAESTKAAYENYQAEAAEYLEIAQYEEQAAKIKNANKDDWENTLDPLFEAIMRNYYGPEVEGAEIESLEWTKFGNDKLNYCTVVFKKGDETYTKILDYKLSAKNNKKGGLIIFEKVEHIIADGVDIAINVDSMDELDNKGAIEINGKVVTRNAEGQFVVYDEAAVEATSELDPETQEITGSEEVVHYEFTEDGTLVKTVTAEVTTTTYTGASLSASDIEEESESAAQTAYLAALQEKIDALGEGESIIIYEEDGETVKAEYVQGSTADLAGFVVTSEGKTRDVSGQEEVTTGYSVTGNYTKLFKGTVVIEDDGYSSESAARNAGNKAYDSYDVSKDSDYNFSKQRGWLGLGIIGGETYGRESVDQVKNDDLTVSSYEKRGLDFWKTHTKYEYKGTYTVSYEEIASVEPDYHEVLKFLNNGKSKEEIIADYKAKIEAAGGVYLGTLDHDWNAGKMTIKYIPGNKVDGAIEITETDESKLEDAYKTALKAKGIDAQRVSITGKTAITTLQDVTNTEEYTAYGYAELNYFLKKVTVDNLTVSTTEWADILAGVTTTQYKNDNYNNGDILLAEYNKPGNQADYYTESGNSMTLTAEQVATTEIFRAKIDGAAATAKMYKNLSEKSANAELAIKEAKARIDALEKAIKALKTVGAREELAELEADLEKAKADLAEAKSIRDKLIEDLEDITDELEDIIDDLTPDNPGPNPRPNEEPSNPTDVIPTPGTPALFTAPAPAAPIIVEDDDVPMVDTPQDVQAEEPAQQLDVEDDGPALAAAPVTVSDDTTPLASMPEQSEMSWWWLLIVLVLGATGAEMYRRHMAKKKAAEITTTETK